VCRLYRFVTGCAGGYPEIYIALQKGWAPEDLNIIWAVSAPPRSLRRRYGSVPASAGVATTAAKRLTSGTNASARSSCTACPASATTSTRILAAPGLQSALASAIRRATRTNLESSAPATWD